MKDGKSNETTTRAPRAVECGNCDWKGTEADIPEGLGGVENLFDRIDPGCEVPVGECPECYTLAYLIEKPETPADIKARREASEVTGHTPLPWQVVGKQIRAVNWPHERHNALIAEIVEDHETVSGKANGEFIVQACNSHAELLRALEDLKKEVRAHVKFDVRKHYSLMVAEVQADKAIRKAKGGAS